MEQEDLEDLRKEQEDNFTPSWEKKDAKSVDFYSATDIDSDDRE